MRAGTMFHCPECGATSPVGTTCDACSVPMIDERGNQAFRPDANAGRDWYETAKMLGIGFGTAVAVATAFPIVALAGFGTFATGLFAAPGVTRALRSRSRLRKRLRLAGLVARIADVKPGRVHVRGLARVLESGGAFAAVDEPGGERRSWRFEVSDGSGAVIVDDDCFEVWRGRRRGGSIPNGATIEVVGRAVMRPVDDAALASGYRDRAILFIEGTAEEPVLMLV